MRRCIERATAIARCRQIQQNCYVVDLREEVSFRVGGVKNPQFLFPAKKAVNACREEVYGVVLSADARTRDFVGDNRGKTSRALFLSVISVLFSLCPQLLAL